MRHSIKRSAPLRLLSRIVTSPQPDKQIDVAFPPLESDNTRVLVLGSMPSQKSLELQQYYGHPQNAFWKIMATLTGVAHDADYGQRTVALMNKGVSVWDTIASCHRPGSMDADIDTSTVSVNDFCGFFERHPKLQILLFNGQASAKTFQTHLGKTFLLERGLASSVMPSTSPAYAAMSLAEKQSIWLDALDVRDNKD
jgi:double-stranded uracil-DNA glycosylase